MSVSEVNLNNLTNKKMTITALYELRLFNNTLWLGDRISENSSFWLSNTTNGGKEGHTNIQISV